MKLAAVTFILLLLLQIITLYYTQLKYISITINPLIFFELFVLAVLLLNTASYLFLLP